MSSSLSSYENLDAWARRLFTGDGDGGEAASAIVEKIISRQQTKLDVLETFTTKQQCATDVLACDVFRNQFASSTEQQQQPQPQQTTTTVLLTVVITFYATDRPVSMLERALASVRSCGGRSSTNTFECDIVVVGSGFVSSCDTLRQAAELCMLHRARFLPQVTDFGCNEAWLKGVAAVCTPFVTILHDDDFFTDEWAYEMQNTVFATSSTRAALLSKVSIVYWAGRIHPECGEIHWNALGHERKTGLYDTKDAYKYFRRRTRYPMSPVVQIFRTDVALHALLECETQFLSDAYYTRPTMLIGNDILMTACSLERYVQYPRVLYVAKPLTAYGRWEGSESTRAALERDRTLARCYANVHRYLLSTHYYAHASSDMLLHDDVPFIYHVLVASAAAGEEQQLLRKCIARWYPWYQRMLVIPTFRIVSPEIAEMPANKSVIMRRHAMTHRHQRLYLFTRLDLSRKQIVKYVARARVVPARSACARSACARSACARSK